LSIAVNRPDEATTLFVYGSLLNPVRREEIIGHAVEVMTATLHHYELSRARYFYIRQHPGISTAGLLLLKLTPLDLQKLDRYEEVPRLYMREKIEVFDQNGNPLRCWIYLPTDLTISDTE
jgi:gamma-glutamylcyclotransferase (GGCT)/AIG2-like uncharacterized protein YtfP